MSSRRPAVTLRELGLVALAALSLGASALALQTVRDRSDPRRALARRVRSSATPRDLAVFTDEAPDLVALMRPVPAVYGSPPLHDLRPFERLWVMADRPAATAPYLARFGPGEAVDGEGKSIRWDLARAGLSRVVWDAASELGRTVQAARDGGEDAGPCPFANGRLVCHGPDWNQPRAEAHRFDGVEVRCLYSHPQADGALVYTMGPIPAGRAVVGAVGIDDAGFFPTGADVTMAVRWQPEGHPAVERTVVARNRKGMTAWSLTAPSAPASATVRITTPNAGARQFCFTLVVTE